VAIESAFRIAKNIAARVISETSGSDHLPIEAGLTLVAWNDGRFDAITDA
jgi:hypothetical protein